MQVQSEFLNPVFDWSRGPAELSQKNGEAPLDAALRMIKSMSGNCLVIQGPPGTGKTYTAASMIDSLVDAGKRVGIASNSHKAIDNVLKAVEERLSELGKRVRLLGQKKDGEPGGGDRRAD